MKDSTGVCSDPSRIATNFNNFFANIGPSLASKVPSTQFSHKDFLVGHFADCFFLNPTSPAEVASIVHSLKNSKCEGVDGLSISPIKETIDLLAVPLSHICNLSFERGRVVQYSQIDSIGVSGDKKGLHWYQWYDWYQ